MQKIVGSILVIVAGACIGFLKGNEMAERVKHMREMKRIFHALMHEIEYTRVPLGQAFLRISDQSRGAFREWLTAISKELLNRGQGAMEQLWSKCLLQHLKETKLSKGDLDLLIRQGAYMGQLDIKMQVSAIRLFLEQWEEQLHLAEQQLESNQRLARCIGTLGGIFLVILLL